MNTVKITYFLAEGKINSKTETLLRVEFIVEIAKSPFFNFSIWLCRRISFCFIYENLSSAVQCFFSSIRFLIWVWVYYIFIFDKHLKFNLIILCKNGICKGTVDDILWPLVRAKMKVLGEVVEGNGCVDMTVHNLEDELVRLILISVSIYYYYAISYHLYFHDDNYWRYLPSHSN